MKEKEKALQWLIDNNKFGKEAGFLVDFEKELNKAIEEENKVITTWLFGNLLFTDENYYEMRWNLGKFVVGKISKEEAEANNLAERSIITFKKDISSSNETEDFRNSAWFKEIEDVYHTFSLIINDRYTPGSRKEIENAKIEVDKLKNKYAGNGEFDKEIAYLEEELKWSSKRKFSGSITTIVGVLIGIFVMFLMTVKADKKIGELTIDKAEHIQKNKIINLEHKIKNTKTGIEYYMNDYNNLKKEVEDLETQEQTNQIKERLAARKKSIQKYEQIKEKDEATIKDAEEEMAQLKSMNSEEYRDFSVKQKTEVADSVTGFIWKTIIWLAVFIISCFPTVYTLNKRYEKNPEKKSSWLWGSIGLMLGSARTIRYRRPDGTTYDDNSEFLGAGAAAIALMGVSIIVIVMFLPYIAVINFARNIVIPYFF